MTPPWCRALASARATANTKTTANATQNADPFLMGIEEGGSTWRMGGGGWRKVDEGRGWRDGLTVTGLTTTGFGSVHKKSTTSGDN